MLLNGVTMKALVDARVCTNCRDSWQRYHGGASLSAVQAAETLYRGNAMLCAAMLFDALLEQDERKI